MNQMACKILSIVIIGELMRFVGMSFEDAPIHEALIHVLQLPGYIYRAATEPPATKAPVTKAPNLKSPREQKPQTTKAPDISIFH